MVGRVGRWVRNAAVVVLLTGCAGSIIGAATAYIKAPSLRGDAAQYAGDSDVYRLWEFNAVLGPLGNTSLALFCGRKQLRISASFNVANNGTPQLVVKALGPFYFSNISLPPMTCGTSGARRLAQASAAERARAQMMTAIIQIGGPAWVPAPLFAAYPLWCFYRGPWRRRRRKAKGQCIRCGYDLTGNITGVCSECGVEISIKEGQPSPKC